MECESVAIIQARLTSRRLPGKMLEDISGRPLLWHVVDRARSGQRIQDTVVATTDNAADDPLVDLCREIDVKCFRGSEEDVLDRFYNAALANRSTIVVRLTGDCPIIDPGVIDQIVVAQQNYGVDYASNVGTLDAEGHFLGRTFPDGLDAEAFTFETLERTWREAELPSEREHLTSYIYKHPERFTIHQVQQESDLSHLRWTVDGPEDLAVVRQIFGHLYSPQRHFTMADVLRLLEKHPELATANSKTEINEGYRESLLMDQRHREE